VIHLIITYKLSSVDCIAFLQKNHRGDIAACSWLPGKALSRRDYERLTNQTKAQAAELFGDIKTDLHKRFTLTFLGLDGRWDKLSVWRFLALPEDHYIRLIKGSKGVRYHYKSDLLRRIAALYKLTTHKQEELAGLEKWFK